MFPLLGNYRNVVCTRIKTKFVSIVIFLGILMPLLLFDQGKSVQKISVDYISAKDGNNTISNILSKSNCIPKRGHWRTGKYAAKLPHCFDPLIRNDNLCSEVPDLLLLIYIYTAPGDFKKRSAIRATYGNINLFGGDTIRVIFPLGLPPAVKRVNASQVQNGINQESLKYKDIIQESFVESYRNLTYKGIMTLKWISNHCKNAKFILKADSDVFINVYSLVGFLKMQSGFADQRIIGCEFFTGMKVIRCSARPDLKSCTTATQYKDAYYPRYCQGAAFLMSFQTASALHKISFNTPIWWVDDVFITGILLRKVKDVQRVGFKKFWVREPKRTQGILKKNPAHFLFLAVKGPVHMRIAWKSLIGGLKQYRDDALSELNMKKSKGNKLRGRVDKKQRQGKAALANSTIGDESNNKRLNKADVTNNLAFKKTKFVEEDESDHQDKEDEQDEDDEENIDNDNKQHERFFDGAEGVEGEKPEEDTEDVEEDGTEEEHIDTETQENR